MKLDEGEVLHLPPTPTMTDGTEHETTKLYPASASASASQPGSGANTPSKRRVPPPLPTRVARPTIDRNDSSASHYSDAVASHAPAPEAASVPGAGAVSADGPPGYDFTSASGPSTSTYPTEKQGESPDVPGYEHAGAPSDYPVEKAEAGVPSYDNTAAAPMDQGPVSPAATTMPEGMTEGERREWEEYYADQQLAQQANQMRIGEKTSAGTAEDKDESLR